MADPSQLPFVLKLLDDPSPTVRRAVREQLIEWGDRLPQLLAELDPPPAPETVDEVLALVPSRRSRGRPNGGTRKKRRASAADTETDDQASATVDTTDARFQIGEVVRHGRYGYRGLVVDSDDACRASEEWYRSNPTQPDRDQPWYHVLVHDSDQITYVAEVNLRADPEQDEVDHPLVAQYFHRRDGKYIRNRRPWPRES